MANRTVEMFFEEYEKKGFIKTVEDGRITYSCPEELGTGGFTLLGDVTSCYACFSDITVYKDLVLIESINEKILEFGFQLSGNATFYQTKEKLFPVDHGLNFYVHDPSVTGYMRIKANERLVSCGLILRETFFQSLPFSLPEDFWSSAMEVLNPDIIYLPQCFKICEEIEKCTLMGNALNYYIYGKGFETLGLVLSYIEQNKKLPFCNLKQEDRKAIEHAKNILNNNFKNPPSIQELAKLVHINQQKLMTGFKQITGTTVYKFIQKIRMQEASILLQTTDLPVVQIAREVGYHGDGHFQKAFFSLYNQTPNDYRKQFK